MTEAEAESYLATGLAVALTATLRYCPVLLNQPENRLAAMVDFTFNLGAGRLLAPAAPRSKFKKPANPHINFYTVPNVCEAGCRPLLPLPWKPQF